MFLVRDMANDRQYALKRILVQDKERVPAIKSELSLMVPLLSSSFLPFSFSLLWGVESIG